MLKFFLKSTLADNRIFYYRLIKLLIYRRCSDKQPKILIFLRSRWNINSCQSPFFLNQILSFVVNQKVVCHYFELFSKTVFVDFIVSSEPLIGHFMFNKTSVISFDGRSNILQSLIRIRVLKNPNCIKVVF
jgi:hypothetical protein